MQPKRILSYDASYLEDKDVVNARTIIQAKCEELAEELYDLNIDMFDACFTVESSFRLAAMRNVAKHRIELEKERNSEYTA